MSFDRILGQERAVERLRALIARGRVPSALLFLGPHGVGKRTAALQFAKALNCGERPGEGCDTCPSCRKIAEGVHPDVEVTSPDGQFVKIDQIRAIADKLALIPAEARRRVVIVHRAERMNSAAANAFLKTLEEPPADTTVVLTAPSPSSLPETIVSRCMPLRFVPLARATLEALLAREGKLSEEERAFAVRHSQGRLRPDLRQGAGKLIVLRDAVLRALEELDRLDYAALSEQAAKWGGGDDWPFVLECFEAWYHDVALLGAGADESWLIHSDRRDAVLAWRRRLPPHRAEACQHAVLAARDRMLLNVNKGLALETLCLSLKTLSRGETPSWTTA